MLLSRVLGSRTGFVGRHISSSFAAAVHPRVTPVSSHSFLLVARRTLVSSTAVAMAPSGAEIRASLFANQSLMGQDIDGAMEALAQADCVCFDVDSTVVDEEGIDVLADFLGQGEQVAALTKQAMEGGMKFQDALALRLDLLRPSRPRIEACLQAHPLQLTPGVADFVAALQQAGKHVYLVSGGFRIMIEPVAKVLGIAKTSIVANTIQFDANGNYTGFDANEPTSADMGKPKALQQIQAAKGYSKMIMIGDGATDAQAKPPAAAFIGFGGVAVREKVKATADWFVTEFEPLTAVVKEFGSK